MTALLTTTGGRAVLLVALLILVSAAWWWGSKRSGTVRASTASAPPPASAALLTVLDAQGSPLGSGATFVQLSSEVCTPCRRTAAVLSALVVETPGVHHVELDAAEHLDLTRALGVLRTPTVLVLDAQGREVGRSSGAMTPEQARAALTIPALRSAARESSAPVIPALVTPGRDPNHTQHPVTEEARP